MEMNFDYVIVGAGSAGCVIANRLSKDPAITVCLVEAGRDDRAFVPRQLVNTPAGTMALIGNPKFDWMHSFSAQPTSGDRDIFCPRGKILGGTSAINGTIYMRGNPRDFDAWAAAGNEGWSYEDVLPLFKAQEQHEDGGSAIHGGTGELPVARVRSPHGVSRAFVASALASGYQPNPDFNSGAQAGFGLFQLNQRRGQRMSSARTFLHPVAHRANLVILTSTATQRVLIEGRRATGIEVLMDGQLRKIRARREVVMSAGAIGSPQLLMLSGIGPIEHLRELRIAPVQDLAVGDNLQDHQDVLLIHESPMADLFGWSLRALPWMMASPFQFYFRGRGPLTSNTVECGGFLKTRPTLRDPDLQLIIRPLLTNQMHLRKIPYGHGFSVHVSLLRPESRGQLRLVSASAQDKPRMLPNFLSSKVDLDGLVAGVQAVREILQAKPMSAYRGKEIQPGVDVISHAEIEAFVRQNVATTFHPAGTCKMGIGPDAVVNPRLCVYGIEGLRVADASIMPTITSGNTNAPTMMIGEKCAQMMLQDARAPRPASVRVAAPSEPIAA